jgi:signal transduction histidine kinase
MRPDRSIRWIRAKADVITDAGGNPMKLIGTAQDITDRKFNQEERRRIEADLVQRNKDLEQFTYIISHNLRAPVANIRGLASLIQSHELDDESHAKCLAGLEASVRRLDDILIDLNNILQVRREISEKRSKVAFNDVVNEILADMRQILVKEQVTFKVDFSAAPEVFSIKGYIHSIFYNLISNSIKYRRPEVAPEIVITSEVSAGHIIVKFRDNGLGFDGENQREKVFGLYKRFHQHVEGKGVGLFMVKTQVETLGGRVDVESAVNKGAEFRLELPA